MKTLVTDGQLGQLAVRQNELFRRVKTGSYVNFDDVMRALQAVIDGRMSIPPERVVMPPFAKWWRTFLIGGVTKEVFLERKGAHFQVSDSAKSMVSNCAFTMSDRQEEMDTIILTPEDFGYTSMPTTRELLDPTRLAEWSTQNSHRLPYGHAVDLLPAEAALYIRDKYEDQPSGELLWLAMERVKDDNRNPSVFFVQKGRTYPVWIDGKFELTSRSLIDSSWQNPDDVWDIGRNIIFRLRKVAQD